MNYDVVLKAMGEATDLRKLMDGLQADIAKKEADIDFLEGEIAKRKNMEGVVARRTSEKKEMVAQLEKHQAELGKRLAKLKDANAALPFDESIAPKPIVNI